MSPLPRRERLAEYAAKGVHAALRELAWAPEQVRARSLAREASAKGTVADGRTVAILTPRSWAASVHWDGMIAQALRMRGARVHFITCGGGLEVCDRVNTWEGPPVPCRSCTGYVHDSIDAHGFPRTALRADWEGLDVDPGIWPELDAVPAADLPSVVDGELALGALVDVPVKWFLLASQLDDDPLAPVTRRRFLRSARRLSQAIASTLDRIRPDTVVLFNGLFLFEAVAFELCRRRGIDVVTYERGHIKETLVFRRGEPACLLDLDGAWQRWKAVPLTASEEKELDDYLGERKYGRRTIDRYWEDAVFAEPTLPPSGRLVSLFPNLTWDSAVIGREIAFPSIQAWVTGAVEAFYRRPEHQLVIRTHPAEVKLPGKQTREPVSRFLAERFPVLPPNVTVIDPDDPRSSYPLMAASDAGLVFTSTTGLELALQGKPVIVAGETHYRGKGFTIDVDDRTAFSNALDRVLADPGAERPNPELARRYAYLFFFRDPVPTPGVEEHVLGLARITVDDLDELAPGANPGVDRICDGILGSGDFLAG